jgi:hypothetical protein
MEQRNKYLDSTRRRTTKDAEIKLAMWALQSPVSLFLMASVPGRGTVTVFCESYT